MILLLALATAAAAPAAGGECYRTAEREILVQRMILRGRAVTYEAVSVSQRLGSPYRRLHGRMVVFGPHCARLFAHDFGDGWEVRFQIARMGGEPVLLATGITPGASGDDYTHVLLGYGRRLREIAPIPLPTSAPLRTSNLGGIFVGNLGRGRGPGLARWEGIWADGEAHYDPHRLEVTLYRWRGGRLERSAHYITRNRLASDPDRAARAMHFPFRDMTGGARFTNTIRIMNEDMRP
jgi:hypothetical protein